jgi:hypothetical protein
VRPREPPAASVITLPTSANAALLSNMKGQGKAWFKYGICQLGDEDQN